MKRDYFHYQICLLTKPKHDSKLYKLITQMTEDLRVKGVCKKQIKEYLTLEIKQIVKET